MGENDTPSVMDDVLMAAPVAGRPALSGADALEARAQVLRAKLMDKIRTEQAENHAQQGEVRRAHDLAIAGAAAADKDATRSLDEAKQSLTRAKEYDAEAAKYAKKGNDQEAEEYRELAQQTRVEADRATAVARSHQAAAERYRADEARLQKEYERVIEEGGDRYGARQNAEIAIDQIEDKARLLRKAETARKDAERRTEDEARMRAEHNDKGADIAARDAARHKADADAAQKAADAKHVDEAALEKVGLVEPAPVVVPPGAPVDAPLAQAAVDGDSPGLDVTGAAEVEAAAADNGDAVAVAQVDTSAPADGAGDVTADTDAGFAIEPEPEVAFAPEPQPEVTFEDPLPAPEPMQEPEPEPEQIALADDGGSTELDQPIG